MKQVNTAAVKALRWLQQQVLESLCILGLVGLVCFPAFAETQSSTGSENTGSPISSTLLAQEAGGGEEEEIICGDSNNDGECDTDDQKESPDQSDSDS